MNAQINLKKVFRFDRSINKLLGQLEVFKNFLESIDYELSEDDEMELLEIARILWNLKDEIGDKELVAKIKEVFRLIASKIEEGKTQEEKIWALRGDVEYLNFLEAKKRGEIITTDLDTFLKELDEL